LIEKAVEVLHAGGLVAFPTETVYGLGANAQNLSAVRRIFAVKGRPESHPLIVHVPDRSYVPAWASEIPTDFEKVAQAFWPGPLTVVLKRSARATDAVTGGQDTIALRVPAHPVAQKLLRAFGGGLAAPSANRFGRVSPTTAEHVRADLGGDVDLILDGGSCAIGVESTILDLTVSPRILRPGGVTAEQLKEVLKTDVPVIQRADIRVPGTLATHYAPKAEVVLFTTETFQTALRDLRGSGRKLAVVLPKGVQVPSSVKTFGVPADLDGFAHELYATLRLVDQEGFDVVMIQRPPSVGLGVALSDRLTRAGGSKST
jgi:L-threonylcarbamoyladenylate synthase